MPSTVSRRAVLAGGAGALLGTGLGLATSGAGLAAATAGRRRPNILLVYLDDLGYGDLGSYGSPLVRTPRLDRLAAEGTRFTQGYSGAPVCTPSRAALLTGRVPPRSGLTDVLYPEDAKGLPAEERTVAEYLQDAGYATACVGKWHVGRPPEHAPTNHGFDRFFGLNGVYTAGTYPFDLWRDGQVVDSVDSDADLATLSRRFTDEAIAAIDAAGDRPFFVYLAEVMPHLPLAVEPPFDGRSRAGLYGDAIESLDHHVGRLLDALRTRGLERDTLVAVVSDNGPWFEGSVGGLRGRKFDAFEGGMRVPFIARWPGVIPAGEVSDAVVSSLDVLPTACALAGVTPDPAVTLDGADVGAALAGHRATDHPPVYYYLSDRLAAVREGRWKLHVVRRGSDQRNLPELYDLSRDPQESYNLAGPHPDVVARLQRIAADHEADVRGAGYTGPLRVTRLDAGPALLAGRQDSARVTIERVPGEGPPEAVEVVVTVDAPDGWTVSTVTRAVEPASSVVVDVPLVAPAGGPVPGLLRTVTLTARVTAAGLAVSGAPRASVAVAPDGAESRLALDAGTATSALFTSYRRLTPSSRWDSAVGFGWVDAVPESRDRTGPDPLRRDMVTDTDAAVLRLHLAAGRNVVSVLRGDHDNATTGIQIEADGSVVLPTGPSVGTGEYWWEQITLDGTDAGRDVDLRISNIEGVYWKVLALLVHTD